MENLTTEILTNYDVTLVFKADLTKTEIKEIVKIFIQNFKFWKGECNKAIFLGKKTLAYPIKKDSRAVFVLLKITASPAAINRFQETIRQTENIVRYQVIKY